MTTQTQPATLVRKAAVAEIKAIDEAKGVVTAAVNTLEAVDFDGDVLASGAFDASIARSLPAVAWMHDQRTLVGGVIEAHEEDARLLATMQFDLDTEPGAYAFKMVARGRLREWSVGFYVTSWRVEEREGTPIRVLEAVEWVEVSPVLRGASPGTQTTGVKQVQGADPPPGPPPLHEPPSDTHGGGGGEPVTEPEPEPDGPSAEYNAAVSRLLEEQRRWLQTDGGIAIPLVVGKAGKRTSAADMRRFQAVHDIMMELGAVCEYDNAPAPEAALPKALGE